MIGESKTAHTGTTLAAALATAPVLAPALAGVGAGVGAEAGAADVVEGSPGAPVPKPTPVVLLPRLLSLPPL